MSLKTSAILPVRPVEVGGQPDGEVAVAELDHRRQQLPRERVAVDAGGQDRRDGGASVRPSWAPPSGPVDSE